ncbi:MAG: HAD family hydrolase [candidate division NC10 bacterium]|nr:HAD family hydrolase [candidate division NC10 bacterium]
MTQRENRKAQLVCFDYDGVLVDSLSRMLRLISRAQSSLGVGRPPTITDLQHIANLNLTDLALTLSIPPDRIPDLAAKLLEIQREEGDRPPIFPGIPETLRQIAQDSIVAVITFNLRDEVLEVLSANRVGDCISLILDGADPRPKRERIRWALEHFRIDAGNAYMVGDARSDIREGRAAGVHTVAVTWGYQPKVALAAEEPDFVANCPEELVTLIRTARRKE